MDVDISICYTVLQFETLQLRSLEQQSDSEDPMSSSLDVEREGIYVRKCLS